MPVTHTRRRPRILYTQPRSASQRCTPPGPPAHPAARRTQEGSALELPRRVCQAAGTDLCEHWLDGHTWGSGEGVHCYVWVHHLRLACGMQRCSRGPFLGAPGRPYMQPAHRRRASLPGCSGQRSSHSSSGCASMASSSSARLGQTWKAAVAAAAAASRRACVQDKGLVMSAMRLCWGPSGTSCAWKRIPKTQAAERSGVLCSLCPAPALPWRGSATTCDGKRCRPCVKRRSLVLALGAWPPSL